MSQDPYEILGVSRGASADEIKKAYRKKARENHPDLHPDDPHAQERMNQINEAYDRLTNPEKYAKQDAREAARNAYNNAGGAGQAGGGAYTYNPFGGYGRGQSTGGETGGGPYGWSSEDFNWDDIFGFGYTGAATDPRSIHPEPSAYDSAEVRSAINDINTGRYAQAATTLASIPSTGRNARWYYLSALANYGAGNQTLAYEQIRRACQIDPNNADYRRAQQAFTQPGRQYAQESKTRGFSMSNTGCIECLVCMMVMPLCSQMCYGAGHAINGSLVFCI